MNIVSSKAPKKYKIFFNFKALLSIVVLFFVFIVIIDSKTYITASKKAILLWANNVLPSLYIFFIFSRLLIDLDFIKTLSNFLSPIMQKLFNTSPQSSHLFFLSILSGFPVGAMLIKQAYKNGLISTCEAHKLTTFSSLTGPAFIFGTIGATMLKNQLAGAIIYFSHLLSAILNGILYRNYKKNDINFYKPTNKNNETKDILSNSISSSINSILLIGGYIVLFYIILEILTNTGLIKILLAPLNNILKLNTTPIFNGLIEITRGISEISSLFSLKIVIILSSLLVSFGGICIHLQSFFFLKDCNIKYSFFLKQKISHAIISFLLTLITTLFM